MAFIDLNKSTGIGFFLTILGQGSNKAERHIAGSRRNFVNESQLANVAGTIHGVGKHRSLCNFIINAAENASLYQRLSRWIPHFSSYFDTPCNQPSCGLGSFEHLSLVRLTLYFLIPDIGHLYVDGPLPC